MAGELEPLSPVLTEEQAIEIAKEFGTPVYVYSQKLLEEQADKALDFPHFYNLTVRYAMKANPNSNILRIFNNKGIKIDASSGFEVCRAWGAGIQAYDILLTSQQIPEGLEALVDSGVSYNACSLHQLENYGKLLPGKEISVRINVGLGSGHSNRTNTGGPGSSFGIWHEDIPKVFDLAERYDLNVKRIHSHVGSGSDPKVWKKVSIMNLDVVKQFEEAGHTVHTLNLGGGYKVGRMLGEKSTDLQECGEPVKKAFEDYAEETGHALNLEIEPGTFLVANAGAVIARVIDLKQTSDYNFILTDSGMTEVTRPSLYGAQHPISVVPVEKGKRGIDSYIVSGHCCESGDILTPAEEDPEALAPRRLLETKIGDLVVIGGAGAYCSGMSIKNYNSYPEAAEVLVDRENKARLIRERQSEEQMTQNEIRVV